MDKLMSAPNSPERCREKFAEWLLGAEGIKRDLMQSNHVSLSENELWLFWQNAWMQALLENEVLRIAV